ncbi:hypothetical protein ABW20_dc0104998 [Dactylellina cionopaga]|nr:hypothetical protein ABW20_dc0104998 [Dactylellina cionopaga]
MSDHASYKPLPGLQTTQPPTSLGHGLPLWGYGTPGPFYFNEKTILFQDDGSGNNDTQSVCANISRSYGRTWGHWITKRLKEFGDPKLPFLNRVAFVCHESQILECQNADCLCNRKVLDKVVPSCQWKNFRDWVMAVVSCQMSFSHEQRVNLPAESMFFHLSASIGLLNGIVEEYKREGTLYDGVYLKDKDAVRKIDAFGVCEVIYWAIRVQRDFGATDYSGGIWFSHFLPFNIYGSAVEIAISEATEKGICPNRLWNLIHATERGEVDFPALIELVKAHPSLKNEGHEECLTSYCKLTTLDSTRVQQLHKCERRHNSKTSNVMLISATPDTGEIPEAKIHFDPVILNTAAENLTFWTVWALDQTPQLLSMGEKYAAISHVWSDGTGIGLGKVGEVNSCLFNYFADCIRDVSPDIKGIWWDTISIPTEPTARRKAINEMHNYYADAECTILHDEYLANFEWKDDGSPCLAIVLSTWFTRGWTALEFIMSKNLKVIFKDAKTGSRIIKDFDNDILAKEACRSSSGYLIASRILKRLRQPISSLSDLLAVLKPRSTSWARDKMIIATLLAGLEIQVGDTQQDLTKKVLQRFRKIDGLALMHDQPTITEKGSWSWCPPSLYDMPVGETDDRGEEYTITEDGAVEGRWFCRLVDRQDISNGIIPASSHSQIIFKIKNALRSWHNCGLLRKHSSDKGPCILVELGEMGLSGINTAEEGQLAWHTSADGLIQSLPWQKAPLGKPAPKWTPISNVSECGYVGAVHVYEVGRLPDGKAANPNYSSYIAGMYKILHGGSHYHPNLDNTTRFKLNLHGDDFAWLHGKLWMGNRADAGDILVPRRDRTSGKTVLQIVKSIRNSQSYPSQLLPLAGNWKPNPS